MEEESRSYINNKGENSPENGQQSEFLNSNDISYDGIEADAAISYNPSFGKIYTGEQFKVLFTLMNTSS